MVLYDRNINGFRIRIELRKIKGLWAFYWSGYWFTPPTNWLDNAEPFGFKSKLIALLYWLTHKKRMLNFTKYLV